MVATGETPAELVDPSAIERPRGLAAPVCAEPFGSVVSDWAGFMTLLEWSMAAGFASRQHLPALCTLPERIAVLRDGTDETVRVT
jgi:hypothetical protein